MRGLAGKVFAMTGGETGIGRAIALRCAAEGALVAAAGIPQWSCLTQQHDQMVGLD